MAYREWELQVIADYLEFIRIAGQTAEAQENRG